MPERYRDYGRKWLALNPGWELHDWTEEEVEDFGLHNAAVWNHIRDNGAVSAIAHRPEVARATQLADVAAYEIIHHYGGVYVNCDMEPLRPINHLPVYGTDAWACREIHHWINNGALGGPPWHPFWEKVIDELPRRFFDNPDSPMHITTGPHLLTKVSDENPGELTVLEQSYFNWTPLHVIPDGGPSEAQKRKMRTDAIRAKAVAIHWWGHKFPESRTDCEG